MRLRKKIFTTAAAVLLAVTTVMLTACGASGFEKCADYVTGHGAAGDGYYSVNAKSDGTDFSAMYYADAEELVFGVRKKTDGVTDALMLVLGKDADICDLLFTRLSDDETQNYAALGLIMLADPECTSLVIADGENLGETDYSMVGVANGYIAALLAGADAHLLADAGLRMSDLGFVY